MIVMRCLISQMLLPQFTVLSIASQDQVCFLTVCSCYISEDLNVIILRYDLLSPQNFYVSTSCRGGCLYLQRSSSSSNKCLLHHLSFRLKSRLPNPPSGTWVIQVLYTLPLRSSAWYQETHISIHTKHPTNSSVPSHSNFKPPLPFRSRNKWNLRPSRTYTPRSHSHRIIRS